MGAEIKKYLGIDWGERRIGLAIGDGETRMAIPYKVVSDIDDIMEAIRAEDIEVVVIGEARKMSNADPPAGGQMSDTLSDFVDILRKEKRVGIEFIDERLTSKAADALSRDRKARAPRDAVAAMLILQTYFDQT